MAHFHVKKKKGRPYLYVREIARVDGKPKVVSQIYIGSPARVADLASGTEKGPVKIKVEEFGALWLAQQMDQDIELAHRSESCQRDRTYHRGVFSLLRMEPNG